MIDRARIAARIPHQAPMCLLDAVESWDEQQIVCRATPVMPRPTTRCRAAGSPGRPTPSNTRRRRWRCMAPCSPAATAHRRPDI